MHTPLWSDCYQKDLGDFIRIRQILLYGIFATLFLVIGFLLISTGMSPKIYQISYDPVSTPLHTNIEVIKGVPVNSSTDLLPVMQDLLDISGTIAVTIRKDDLDSAGSELAKYSKRYQDLDNLIIKLDMKESEVANFSRNIKQQDDLLRQFINTSESLHSLKTLEIQYHEDNDPTSMTTVQLQGKVLTEKIRSLNNRYAAVSSGLSDQGASKGLNTTRATKGREEINNFTRSLVSDQEDQEDQKIYQQSDIKIGQFLSFLVQPNQRGYRDTVDLYGYLTGGNVTGQKIVILLDANPLLGLVTDETGLFRTSYEVGNITTGDHSMVAVSGLIQSRSQALVVSGCNTTLTLSMKAINNQSEVSLTGNLYAQKPVKMAPVQILVNNETWKMTVTGDTGRYMTNLSFPQGTFLVSALFEDSSFPLNESRSMTYEIVSTGTSISSITRALTASSQPARPKPLWVIPILFVCLIGVFFLYMRRKGIFFKELKDNGSSGVESNQPLGLINSGKLSSSWLSSHEQLAESLNGSSRGTQPTRVNETAYVIYTRLVNRLSHDLNTPHIRTLTPREISARICFHPHADILRRFIRLYEQIRYGRYEGEEDVAALDSLISDLNVAFGRDQCEE